MSKQTYSWTPGLYDFTWSKNRGTYRQEVIGPCGNGGKYLRKKNENPFGFSHRLEYDWGAFYPPIFDSNGNPEFPGQFTRETGASEADWIACWQNPPATQPQPQPEQNPGYEIDTDAGTDTLTDWAQTFTSSNNTKRNLIIAAAAIAVLTLIVVVNID